MATLTDAVGTATEGDSRDRQGAMRKTWGQTSLGKRCQEEAIVGQP